jgi:ATP diphosphatase
MSEELGDLLFALANLARHLNIDAEGSLRQATQKFGHRFRRVEKQLTAAGCDPLSMSGEELEALWQAAKGTPGPVDEPVDNFADDTGRAFGKDVTSTPSGEER